MASCGPPPLGRFLGPALLQFAFIRGGSLNVFTPRLKTIIIAPTMKNNGAHLRSKRRRGTDHSGQACQAQWLFVSPLAPVTPWAARGLWPRAALRLVRPSFCFFSF